MMYNIYYSILDEVLAKKKIVLHEILVVEDFLGKILVVEAPMKVSAASMKVGAAPMKTEGLSSAGDLVPILSSASDLARCGTYL